VPATLALSAQDDGLPNPPGQLSYVLTTLPAHGVLSDPAGGAITAVPYTLLGHGHTVSYVSSSTFAGADGFTFVANDGGEPPEGGDSNPATVSLTVSAVLQYAWGPDLETDPGWSADAGWAWGVPQGGGSHDRDPVSGHTGSCVYGYNLAGDYANNLLAPRFLTTPPIDCTNVSSAELRFWRWLGVERFDHAAVEVSSDGANWTTLWANPPTANVSDSAWMYCAYNIAALADGQPAVQVRWCLGTTDATITFPGWNLDDVSIWGFVEIVPPVCRGDANCDGTIGFADIDYFVAAIPNNYAAWSALFGGQPDCPFDNCDVDGDGNVSFADIDPFVAAIPSACP
jgi:hypothetical protein